SASALQREFEAAMDNDFQAPAALAALDAAATRGISGAGAEGEAAALRAALTAMGFAFAGARGPANGDFSP
ncbi:MAG: hypothetical protein WBO97_02920, partial [Tepidiformaceae bacterium]